MQKFRGKMSRFKKMDEKFEFTPEEIIMFYVQPSDFLKKKFNDQWQKSTELEIKLAKENYAKMMNQIKSKFKSYFQTFLIKIQDQRISLSTNVFIPQDKDYESIQYLTSQNFRVHSQKAMAMYMGLVINKQWKDGTVLVLDDQTEMIHPANRSLVKHEDVKI